MRPDGEDIHIDVSPGKGVRVLIIEDEENIREVLEEMLSAEGYAVVQAKSGEEGIDIFKKQKVDLVITDLGMTRLSGWEVADQIKALAPHTPVILSTGWGVKLDQFEMHKKNIDRILRKPFKMEQILNMISELLGQEKDETRRE